MNDRGATLIELVVAMTLSASVLAGAYGALATVIDRGEAAEEQGRSTREAAALRASIEGWLEASRLLAGSSRPLFVGVDAEDGGIPADEVTFMTAATTPVSSTLTTIRLYVRHGVDGRSSLQAGFTPWLGAESAEVTLLEGIAGIDIHYRSDVLSGRAARDSWISSTVLPKGVDVRLVPEPGVELHPLLSIPLRVRVHSGG